ncbi:hypothetical protein [Cupriavidus sp. IDO]|nr:hypothetical protein [Cupriavidus sp. IDO]
MTTHYMICDGVAVITLDNPPVNGLRSRHGDWGTGYEDLPAIAG